jgi:hypothetical protein
MNEFEKVEPVEETTAPVPVANTEVVAAENVSVEESVEIEQTEESPRYHAMSKDELLAAMKEIMDAGNMEAHREVTAMKQAFFNLKTRENLEELNAFVEAGNQPEAFSALPDEKENEFKQLYAKFKEQRAAYLEQAEETRRQNLAKKQEILDKMKAIADDIEQVNTHFQDFQTLQQEFKAIKDVPAQAETDIWKSFQTVVEQFYDHLKMNKELRDLDFKKNLEAKRSLIEQAKKLADVSDPIAAFRTLQGLHDEWRNLGPVAKELREEIWEEFKEASSVVNKRHQEYFEQRKASEQANEEAKTKICDELDTIDLATMKSFADWTTATDRIIELQKNWKELGFASRKANTALYTRFRSACDKFFEAKAEFFKKSKEELSSNLEKKTKLCERVEALKEETDLKKAMDEVVKLQGEWKKIGGVPRKVSDALWKRFTVACNYFFDERKKQNRERRREETDNLDAKRKVIEELKALPKDGDRAEVIGKVKELQNKWNEIGFVPFKMKDRLYADYREVVDALYNAYNTRESRQRMHNFENRVSELKGDDRMMGRERDRLVRALEGRRLDLKTIENNMGFFNVKSSAGSSLLKDMEHKIKRLKDDIKEIEDKIALLDKE